MAKHWTLDDIPWDKFDRSKVNPDIEKIVKAAALVEGNADDYVAYLSGVFSDDPVFSQAAHDWAKEEVQHGAALGRWAEMVDPSFSFDRSFARFREGFKIDTQASSSIRGSRSGELIARCMVETGTSSYYTALGEATDEPVLKEICQRIAADELRHYKLFYDHLKRYIESENLNKLHRVKIALGRIVESEDDELAYAYYAANAGNEAYDRRVHSRAYMKRAYSYYQEHHMDRAIGMIFKACGLRPQTRVFKVSLKLAWFLIQKRSRQLSKMAA